VSRFTTLTSLAAPLPDADIDTDVIIPARFLLLLEKAGIGRHLFHERRATNPDFVLNRPPYDQAQILVAGHNFGCGSSREQAVWALVDFGMRCVIAPSFGEIFFANCFKNGALPIVLDLEPYAAVLRAAEAKLPVTVDLTAEHIRLPAAEPIPFAVDPHRRRALLLGLDEIGMILAEDLPEIEAFEARQRQSAPWLFREGAPG
jgi:3-isopropylmalate/(R)-2-methylmalate dehydratase small subunit